MRVRCELSDLAPDRAFQDGDAADLPTDTELREVADFDPRFRLAAVRDGKTLLFEAETPAGAKTGEDLFPGLRPHIVAISLISQLDGTTELAREDDPQTVATMVADLLAAPYTGFTAIDADVSVGLVLDDGTVVRRAYVSDRGLLLPGLQLPADLSRRLEALGP